MVRYNEKTGDYMISFDNLCIVKEFNRYSYIDGFKIFGLFENIEVAKKVIEAKCCEPNGIQYKFYQESEYCCYMSDSGSGFTIEYAKKYMVDTEKKLKHIKNNEFNFSEEFHVFKPKRSGTSNDPGMFAEADYEDSNIEIHLYPDSKSKEGFETSVHRIHTDFYLDLSNKK